MSIEERGPVGAVRRIFENVGLLLGGKAIAGLMSLAYLFIVTRALGASGFGVLILLHGYVTLIGEIVAFSGWHGIVRYGPYAPSRRSRPTSSARSVHEPS